MNRNQNYQKYVNFILNKVEETYNYAPGVLQDNIDGTKYLLEKYRKYNIAETVYNLIQKVNDITFDDIMTIIYDVYLQYKHKNI